MGKKKRSQRATQYNPASPVHLDPVALDWALAHVRAHGDTVFLPRAFEYEAIEQEWTEIKNWLTTQDMRDWQPRPKRRFLSNKGPFSFRYVTQLDPLENLAFASLVYCIGRDLEKLRLPVANNVVFSWRFAPEASGRMYDPECTYTKFNDQCQKHAKQPITRFVVVADIADFFSHIYLHPMERAILKVTDKDRAWCIIRMIKNWNAKVSYGLPIGLASSRIIAEATISDIDAALGARNQRYCRYSDDFRIFCSSEQEAHEALEFLSLSLFESHGLTLNTEKTEILPVNEYMERFELSPERLEIEGLADRFSEWLDSADIEDDYETEIDFDDLPEDVQEELRQLNLEDLLDRALEQKRPNPIVMSFLLHRLGQVGFDHSDKLIQRLPQLSHVVDAVVRYFLAIQEEADTNEIGDALLKACAGTTMSRYHRTCLLSAFTKNTKFDHEAQFEQLYENYKESSLRRELVLALGRAHARHWFMARRRDIDSMDPWLRRAFLAAFSCVDEDARQPFYQSLGARLDPLDDAVIEWAIENPF